MVQYAIPAFHIRVHRYYEMCFLPLGMKRKFECNENDFHNCHRRVLKMCKKRSRLRSGLFLPSA